MMGVCRAAVHDIMLGHHLLCPDLPHDLGFIASCFTNKPAWKFLASEDLELYCCRDTDATFQIYQQLLPLLRMENLLSLYELVQVPLAKICRLMYETGVRVNPGRITEARTALKAEALKLEADIPEKLRTRKQAIKQRQPAPPGTLGKSGKPVKYVMVDAEETVQPWRSPDVIKEWLYEELALPVQTNPKTHKVSTDKFALEKLLRQCRKTGKLAEARSIEALQRLRKVDELLTTFVSEAITQVERVHPHFNVHGTASGRLSSSEPNLQNIPESARIIYVPDYDDWEWASVDFSQIENRLTAHFARDHERMQRFLVDPNFSEHKFAASLFFNIPIEDVQKDNDKDAPYGKAKRIVHGVNYGMGPRKIVNMYDMDFREVRELIAKWKGAIAPTSKWQEETAAQAKRDGVLTTPFGRKRWFYTTSYFTESLSFLPQSTAADIIFRAMIGLMYERIGWPVEKALKVVSVVEPLPEPAKLLLQVHDELDIIYPRHMRERVLGVVQRVMTQPWPELGGLSIPIGISVGPSWGEVRKYKLEG